MNYINIFILLLSNAKFLNVPSSVSIVVIDPKLQQQRKTLSTVSIKKKQIINQYNTSS